MLISLHAGFEQLSLKAQEVWARSGVLHILCNKYGTQLRIPISTGLESCDRHLILLYCTVCSQPNSIVADIDPKHEPTVPEVHCTDVIWRS